MQTVSIMTKTYHELQRFDVVTVYNGTQGEYDGMKIRHLHSVRCFGSFVEACQAIERDQLAGKSYAEYAWIADETAAMAAAI